MFSSLLILTWALLALTTAQPRCDPQTQYELNGQCCNMCGKGTSMTSIGTCQEPQCKACPQEEYQEGYTKESNCERQPYCDPNLNFEVPDHQSTTVKTICKCQDGFHCASKECNTCVPHKECKPGFGAEPKGNHTHDTVCKECSEGTFSKTTSWDSVCEKWTPCEGRYYTEEEGTTTSDNKCAPSRIHIIAICLTVGILVIAGLVLFFIFRERVKEKAKPCIELCCRDEHQPLRETGLIRTPEENEAEESLQEITSEGVTEKGYPVREEDGKSEILSRQESQTESF